MKRRAIWIDIGILFLIAIASSLLTYCDYRHFSPFDSPDIRAHQQNAIELLREGKIPVRGQGTSYSTWGPPGTSYLMIPGVLLFQDWRLQEIPGAFLLHLGTLWFVYLIGKRLLGRGAGLAAAFIAGFMPLTGPTLWPNGHPFFVMGLVYCLIRWAQDKAAWGMAGAILLAGAGLYVYPTIAPAVLVIPIVWIVFRNPVRWRQLALAIAGLFLLWFPYLQFEMERSFIDISSMVLRQSADAGGETPVYCYAARAGELDQIDNVYIAYTGTSDPSRVAYPGGGRVQNSAYRVCVFLMHIDQNFDAGYFLLGANEFGSRFLYGLFLFGVFVLGGCAWRGRWSQWSVWRTILPVALLGSALLWLGIQPEWIAEKIAAPGQAQGNVILVAEQLRVLLPLFWFAGWLGVTAGSRIVVERRVCAVMATTIVISCVLLAMLAEPERPWRFWWLWPLQTIGLIAAVGGISAVLGGSLWWKRSLLIGCMVIAFPLAHVGVALQNIVANGYGGAESGQLDILRILDLAAEEKHTRFLSVGVIRIPSNIDPTRPGGWLDFGLFYSYDVQNNNSGDPSSADDFRLVEYRLRLPENSSQYCPWDGWRAVYHSIRFVLCAPNV